VSQANTNGVGASANRLPAWRRWLAQLAAMEEALSLSPDEIQDRRIARLEAEVAELRKRAHGGEQ